MNRETKMLITIISIALAIFVIVLLLLFGYDLSGLEIHKGIKLN